MTTTAHRQTLKHSSISNNIMNPILTTTHPRTRPHSISHRFNDSHMPATRAGSRRGPGPKGPRGQTGSMSISERAPSPPSTERWGSPSEERVGATERWLHSPREGREVDHAAEVHSRVDGLEARLTALTKRLADHIESAEILARAARARENTRFVHSRMVLMAGCGTPSSSASMAPRPTCCPWVPSSP